MHDGMQRREFLAGLGAGTAAALGAGPLTAAERSSAGPAQTAIPRWRGFNLTNFFQALSDGESR